MSSLFHGVALRMIARQLPLRRGANVVRQFLGFVGNFDTGFTQFLYQYSVRAPPKSLPCVRGGGSALAEPVGLPI